MATEDAFCRKRNRINFKKEVGRQAKKFSSWNPGWMLNDRRKQGLTRASCCLWERGEGKEMNVQLYISFDSVTKTNSSKTLRRLG